MNELMKHYQSRISPMKGSLFTIFEDFFKVKLPLIDDYLTRTFAEKTKKCDNIAEKLRKEGNSRFASEEYVRSIDAYTEALCYAIPKQNEYAKALANRSAVLFKLAEYEQCIEDIDVCFESDYPNDLKPKVYMRKILCYSALKDKIREETTIIEFRTFLETCKDLSSKDKEKYIREVDLHNNKIYNFPQYRKLTDTESELPEFPHIEIKEQEKYEQEDNEKQNSIDGKSIFACASDKTKLRYSNEEGRYVVARQHIEAGEVLFVEKAFAFAPLFSENKELYRYKCFYCLTDQFNVIPCTTCTKCVYCNEKCRISSWEESHQWECPGMKTNFWNDVGMAFPAFKAFTKGIKSGFQHDKNPSPTRDIEEFGDKEDNYPYFSKLESNIFKKRNMVQIIVMSAVVVKYLKRFTNFFAFIYTLPNRPKNDMVELISFCGGLIAKHLGQFFCNSTTIQHWTYATYDVVFPNLHTSVACGIFPSVSMMNHSCKPNTTTFFIKDTIVVKALDFIERGQEIFNCYGINYRTMDKQQRQLACRDLYHFECNCCVCSNPKMEMDVIDSFLCPNCKGPIPERRTEMYGRCLQCKESYQLIQFRCYRKKSQKYLKGYCDMVVRDQCWEDNLLKPTKVSQPNRYELLEKCLDIRRRIFSRYHKDTGNILYVLYQYFYEIEDVMNMITYFEMWVEVQEGRLGVCDRSIGAEMYETGLAIAKLIPSIRNVLQKEHFIRKINSYFERGFNILSLYYPSYVTNKLPRTYESETMSTRF